MAFESGLPATLALLQLASPALPVGGFAYSQGLETAVEQGLVTDEATAAQWIADMLEGALARAEAPWWLRAFDARRDQDLPRLSAINQELLALRETAELRAESVQMGHSMARIFATFGCTAPPLDPMAYSVAFACLCADLQLSRCESLAAWLWSWAENQVLVVIKTVPLGQMAGQRLLAALRPAIARAAQTAQAIKDNEIGSAAIGYALACADHEHQYSRLFRS